MCNYRIPFNAPPDAASIRPGHLDRMCTALITCNIVVYDSLAMPGERYGSHLRIVLCSHACGAPGQTSRHPKIDTIPCSDEHSSHIVCVFGGRCRWCVAQGFGCPLFYGQSAMLFARGRARSRCTSSAVFSCNIIFEQCEHAMLGAPFHTALALTGGGPRFCTLAQKCARAHTHSA